METRRIGCCHIVDLHEFNLIAGDERSGQLEIHTVGLTDDDWRLLV